MYVECSCSHESHPCNYRRRNAYEDCLHLRIIKHMPQLTRVFCHNEPKFFRTGINLLWSSAECNAHQGLFSNVCLVLRFGKHGS
ncbi:unnamed protein product [Tenebrio molitor]|nr:unnamed protein product [Tenebrio molitor]